MKRTGPLPTSVALVRDHIFLSVFLGSGPGLQGRALPDVYQISYIVTERVGTTREERQTHLSFSMSWEEVPNWSLAQTRTHTHKTMWSVIGQKVPGPTGHCHLPLVLIALQLSLLVLSHNKQVSEHQTSTLPLPLGTRNKHPTSRLDLWSTCSGNQVELPCSKSKRVDEQIHHIQMIHTDFRSTSIHTRYIFSSVG